MYELWQPRTSGRGRFMQTGQVVWGMAKQNITRQFSTFGRCNPVRQTTYYQDPRRDEFLKKKGGGGQMSENQHQVKLISGPREASEAGIYICDGIEKLEKR